MMSTLLIGVLSTLLLLSQNVAASSPISKQVKQLRSGDAIQVHMTDGRIIEGKLVSASGPSFELLEPDHESAVTIECADVTAVNQVSTRPKAHRKWVT